MRAGNAIDQDIEIDRPLDLDHVVDHAAKIAAVADIVEPLAVGRHHDAGIGLLIRWSRALPTRVGRSLWSARINPRRLLDAFVVVCRRGSGFRLLDRLLGRLCLGSRILAQ